MTDFTLFFILFFFYFLPNDGFYTSHPRKASCLKHQDSARSPLSSVNSLICRGSPYSCVDYHTINCDGITHICNLYNSIEEGCIKKLGNVKVLVKGQKGQKKSKKTLSNIYKTEKNEIKL